MSLTDSSPHQKRFRELIFQETGLKMPEAKEFLIASRLRKRLLDGGHPDLHSYFVYLFEEGGLEQEWPEIVDLITTNKTDFFREPAHFDILADKIIPSLLKAAKPGATVRFRMWSAAASTGAEAYTAAMILAEAARENALLDWLILGTDISLGILAQAERAIYPAKEIIRVPQQMQHRYLMQGRDGSTGAHVRIAPEIRRRVRFAQLNLIAPPYPIDRDLDVIFLRNVLIYFEPDQQERVVREIVSHLKPGGYLFVGHAESMVVEDARLDLIAPAAFQRKGGVPCQ